MCVCALRVCVYTVITNGFSSFHCSCTILKSRGQRYPCHFLCQRSWVTCGKDIDQGRVIYVPAIVSTVDFLFLFMSCALFLRSGTCVRWNSTARQLRKSGEDYDILHTFDWPLPHSVCVGVCVWVCGCGCVGVCVWVCGCVGVWVCGCVGVCVCLCLSSMGLQLLQRCETHMGTSYSRSQIPPLQIAAKNIQKFPVLRPGSMPRWEVVGHPWCGSTSH